MHSQQPPGVVQNWSTLQCSKQNTKQCGYDHAPVTRGRMRAQFPLPHGPPPRPRPRDPGELTPATVVWARLGLEEMPSPASTETSRASLRAPEDEEPLSPLRPRVLLDETDDSSATSEDAGHGDGDAAPGVEVRISAEGYTDDTYMLAMCIMTLQLMLLATGQWVQLTGPDINVKKSMLFGVRGPRGTTAPPLRAELNGEAPPLQHEFRQLGVGVRTTITKGTGPLLEARMDSAK